MNQHSERKRKATERADLTDDGDDAAGRGAPSEVRQRPRRRRGRRGWPRCRRRRGGRDLREGGAGLRVGGGA
jgi:hypothetical protein